MQANDRPNASPHIISIISDVDTPVSVFHKLSEPGKPSFLLESTEGDNRLARYSFIGIDPIKTVSFRENQAVIENSENGIIEAVDFDNPLNVLEEMLEEFRQRYQTDKSAFPFSGGLVGYMGYAATQYFERIPQQQSDPFDVPEGCYGLYDTVVAFDHQYRRIHVLSYRGEDYAKQIIDRLMVPSQLEPLFTSSNDVDEKDVFANVRTALGEQRFVELVGKCKEYIEAGQVFQIVLSHRFSLEIETSALDFYRVLQALNPSPYAYYLRYPEFDYVGSSPETFVRCQDGKVTLRAIAGTRPRGTDEAEDEALAVELKSNEKEMAEHRMLVDLGRNDLGRVCKVGTVCVGEIATLTKYTHVMHLATEISGELQDDESCFSAFQGCFPRGTVSGAPKVRAMQLLSQLEPERRGVYSGVVGYFDFHGNMDGAIAIRSALIKDGTAHVNAGAGIVLDSSSQAEYEETCNKARSLIKAVKLVNQFSGQQKWQSTAESIPTCK